jgi:sulfur carrier protein ThiS
MSVTTPFGAGTQFATVQLGDGSHVQLSLVAKADGTAVDFATQTTLAAVLAKLNGSVAVTLSAQPLPAGAATEASLARQGPAKDSFVIVPNDTAALPKQPNALFVTATGNLVYRSPNSTADVTLTGIPAWTTLPFGAQYVRATGTTATVLGLI